MIERRVHLEIERRLQSRAAVCLLGPRQVGKTTLALQVADGRPSHYLDMEKPSDLNRLAEPELYLAERSDELVIIDEVQRVPGLFEVLRGLIDHGRREGRGGGRFLLLGSAAPDLLRQSSESLAGRIAYLELGPFDLTEVEDIETLWLRGGFPLSFLASRDAASAQWREDFIRTYLERDIPQLGPRIPAERLRRLWTMLAHSNGALLNASRLASGLGIASSTVSGYVDLLSDLFLVRRLQPWHANVGKRLVKSPKIYVRDTGILHTLLGIETRDQLMGHPVLGPSWEGFAIENLLAVCGGQAEATFYRSQAGAEIDLVLEFHRGETLAVEIKRTASPKPTRGLREAIKTVKPDRTWIVYPGEDRFPLDRGIEAIGLRAAITELNRT